MKLLCINNFKILFVAIFMFTDPVTSFMDIKILFAP